jgi:uncharacterized protein (DUF1015 family)
VVKLSAFRPAIHRENADALLAQQPYDRISGFPAASAKAR